MAKYSQAVEIEDGFLTLTEQQAQAADIFIDSQLWERGIDPAVVGLPQPLLTEIARLWTKRQAAIEGAVGENSPLLDQAKQFELDALRLVNTISFSALGLSTSNITAGVTGSSSITLGRG